MLHVHLRYWLLLEHAVFGFSEDSIQALNRLETICHYDLIGVN